MPLSEPCNTRAHSGLAVLMSWTAASMVRPCLDCSAHNHCVVCIGFRILQDKRIRVYDGHVCSCLASIAWPI
jgi:hypothetical protein